MKTLQAVMLADSIVYERLLAERWPGYRQNRRYCQKHGHPTLSTQGLCTDCDLEIV